MNIQSVNCTPIKPQVSFRAQGDHEKKYQDAMAMVSDLGDDLKKSAPVKNKNAFETAVSLGVAAFVTYAGGKFFAAKAMEVFPGIENKAITALRKSANLVKDKSNKLAANPNKYISKVASYVNKGEESLRAYYKKSFDAGLGNQNAVKNIAGLTSFFVGMPKITTADGNNDGTPDIAQKKVNAYTSAMQNLDTVSKIVEVVS